MADHAQQLRRPDGLRCRGSNPGRRQQRLPVAGRRQRHHPHGADRRDRRAAGGQPGVRPRAEHGQPRRLRRNNRRADLVRQRAVGQRAAGSQRQPRAHLPGVRLQHLRPDQPAQRLRRRRQPAGRRDANHIAVWSRCGSVQRRVVLPVRRHRRQHPSSHAVRHREHRLRRRSDRLQRVGLLHLGGRDHRGGRHRRPAAPGGLLQPDAHLAGCNRRDRRPVRHLRPGRRQHQRSDRPSAGPAGAELRRLRSIRAAGQRAGLRRRRGDARCQRHVGAARGLAGGGRQWRHLVALSADQPRSGRQPTGEGRALPGSSAVRRRAGRGPAAGQPPAAGQQRLPIPPGQRRHQRRACHRPAGLPPQRSWLQPRRHPERRDPQRPGAQHRPDVRRHHASDPA